MGKLKQIGKWLFADTLIYKCALIVMAFAYILPITAGYVQGMMKAFLLWGAVIAAWDLVTKRACLQSRMYSLFYAFVVLTGISALAHFDQQLVRNAVYSLYLVAFAAIPLVVDRNKNEQQVYRDLKVIGVLLAGITAVMGLIALGIFAADLHGAFIANGAEYPYGFVEGRLYGPLGNPNSTAHVAMLSMVFSGVIIAIVRKRWVRGLMIANLAVQFVVMSLGNSRSALVGLCAMVTVGLFFYFRNHRIKLKKQAALVAVSGLLAVAIGVGGVTVASKLSNRTMGFVPPLYHMLLHPTQTPDNQTPDSTDPSNPSEPDFEITDTDRVHTTDDTSNGRFTIWMAGLRVAKENWQFGVGSENILEAVNQKLPADFVENLPGLAANMHNVYLQVLVGNGVPAVVCFVGFFIWLLLKAWARLWRQTGRRQTVMLLLLCGVAGMLVENLFDSNLIGFMCLFIVPVFWTMCGYLRQLTEGVQEIEEGSVSH